MSQRRNLFSYSKSPTDYANMETFETENIYQSYLLQIALNMFQYENLPESIDEFYLEYILQTRGFLIIVNDDIFGLTALECAMGGRINHYYLPTSFRGVDPTGELTKNYSLDEVVLCKNSPLFVGTIPFINYYARELSLCSRTIDVNLDAQWTPYIIAGDKRMKSMFQNFIDQVRKGVKTIFTWSNFDLNSINVLPTQAPWVAESVNVLKQSILRECMTLLGIDNANQDKKERVQSAEVNANNTQIIASRNIWISEREKFVKKLNEKYGTNVKVSFRAYNDILDMIEVNNNSIDLDISKGGEENADNE